MGDDLSHEPLEGRKSSIVHGYCHLSLLELFWWQQFHCQELAETFASVPFEVFSVR